MVGERLVEKVTAMFSALALSSTLGCATMQKPVRMQLNKQGLSCTITRPEGKPEIMRCGSAEYTLQNRTQDRYVPETTISTYERKKGDRKYRARTETHEGRNCPVSMDIELDNGTYHVEFDEACNAWGIRKIQQFPEY